jgi:serine phosphatase RsbU (regulator of sigma subunit)
MGLFGDFAYEAEQIDLKPGTRVIAYTDGVTEAEKADLSQYGEERLLEWAKAIMETSPEMSQKDIVENLCTSVKAFTEGNAQNDDITIVSLQLEKNS